MAAADIEELGDEPALDGPAVRAVRAAGDIAALMRQAAVARRRRDGARRDATDDESQAKASER